MWNGTPVRPREVVWLTVITTRQPLARVLLRYRLEWGRPRGLTGPYDAGFHEMLEFLSCSGESAKLHRDVHSVIITSMWRFSRHPSCIAWRRVRATRRHNNRQGWGNTRSTVKKVPLHFIDVSSFIHFLSLYFSYIIHFRFSVHFFLVFLCLFSVFSHQNCPRHHISLMAVRAAENQLNSTGMSARPRCWLARKETARERNPSSVNVILCGARELINLVATDGQHRSSSVTRAGEAAGGARRAGIAPPSRSETIIILRTVNTG